MDYDYFLDKGGIMSRLDYNSLLWNLEGRYLQFQRPIIRGFSNLISEVVELLI